MEGTKKVKSRSIHQYSWNSEVDTTWISLIGWPHKTSIIEWPSYELFNYDFWGWKVQDKRLDVLKVRGWKVWEEWIVLQPFGRTDGRHYISASIFFRHCRSFCKSYVHSQYLVRSCIDWPLCHLRCHLRPNSWNCVCFYWTRLNVSFTNYDYKMWGADSPIKLIFCQPL